MKFDELLKDYPRIQWASIQNQEALFSVIDQTALTSSALQISFERRPDFFAFLKAQGHKAGVFTFHNRDGLAHGFACFSFRKMKWKGQEVSLGYSSDLRTTPQLDRDARVQWRRMYGLSVKHIQEIDDFDHPIGFVTAVWHENKAAQRALVSQSKSKDFQYQPVHDYLSYSIWGKWNFWRRPSTTFRRVKSSEIETIRHALLSGDGLTWQEDDLQRTLQVFGKFYEDFYVIEKSGQIQAFGLDVSQSHLKKLKIKRWPQSLSWAAKLLPLFGKRAVRLHDDVEMRQLVFFRSLQGQRRQNLIEFIDHLWLENSRQPRNQQFHILNFFSWGSQPLELDKAGYLNTSVSGSLYKVVSSSTHPDFLEMQDFSNLEGNFL